MPIYLATATTEITTMTARYKRVVVMRFKEREREREINVSKKMKIN